MNKVRYNSLICSYPRSGNHWVRYIVEFISKRPTLGAGEFKWATTVDAPIFDRMGESSYYENSNFIAKKTHSLSKNDIKEKDMLFVIRDYKEILLRKHKISLPLDKSQKRTVSDYLELIRGYHNCNNKKQIIYYEDLVTDPSLVVEAICSFFSLESEDHNERKQSFLNDIGVHKEKCISLYNKINSSNSRGENIKFYSKDSNVNLEEVDAYVRNISEDLNNYINRYQRQE